MQAYYLCNPKPSDPLKAMLDTLHSHFDLRPLPRLELLTDQASKCMVICVDLSLMGDDAYVTSWLHENQTFDFKGWQGAFLVVSQSQYFTKRYTQQLIFNLNRLGMAFMGHPMVEATKDYENCKTWQKTYNLPLNQVCMKRVEDLAYRLKQKQEVGFNRVLALHASSQTTSNTLMLGTMVVDLLPQSQVKIMHIENGEVVDCKGCDYTTCLHHAKHYSCFYGGQVTNEILPAIEWADVIIWLCPNYNDAVSAMHAALINRLTVLYRRIHFYNKAVYGIVVSGNSGSDSVACQLIGALCLNKGFRLPPHAFLDATANHPGTIMKVNNLENKVKTFVEGIKSHLLGPTR